VTKHFFSFNRKIVFPWQKHFFFLQQDFFFQEKFLAARKKIFSISRKIVMASDIISVGNYKSSQSYGILNQGATKWSKMPPLKVH